MHTTSQWWWLCAASLGLGACGGTVVAPSGNVDASTVVDLGQPGTDARLPPDDRPVPPPGCTRNAQCSAGLYCSAEGCDLPGQCVQRPQGCSGEFSPVCGCDGRTYPNACAAATEGVNVARAGMCTPPPPDGGTTPDSGSTACAVNGECGRSQYCNLAACGGRGLCVGRPTVCSGEFSPVCGCDGRTYGNACAAASAGVSIAARGACGNDAGTAPVDAGPVPGVCATIRCGAGTACCDAVGAPAYGTCYDTRCLSCCMPRPAFDAGVTTPCTGNDGCSDGQYCAATACGGRGTCAVRPPMCTREYAPVCGCDGRTYSNPCLAALAGVNVASRGVCPAPVVDAGSADAAAGTCLGNSDCPSREYCDGDACDGPGRCVGRPAGCITLFDPVCGCDGRTYNNACTAASVGVRVAARGACSTSTDAGVTSRCALVRCAAGYTCCALPGSPQDGTCFPSTCRDCCR